MAFAAAAFFVVVVFATDAFFATAVFFVAVFFATAVFFVAVFAAGFVLTASFGCVFIDVPGTSRRGPGA
jgi:hypothetical protein